MGRLGKKYGPLVYGVVDKPVFSPDSKRIAFIGRVAGGQVLVVDNEEGKKYEYIAASSIAFSPDSKHLAYVAVSDNKWITVIDGKEQKLSVSAQGRDEPDTAGAMGRIPISDPVFSPDSNQAAYVVETGGEAIVVLDDKEFSRSEYIVKDSLTFSPNSQRLAYIGSLGDKWFVVVDGKKQEAYDNIGKGSLAFSPDNMHVIYVAVEGKKCIVIVDGKKGDAHDYILLSGKQPIVFTSSKDFHYFAFDGEEVFLIKEEIL